MDIQDYLKYALAAVYEEEENSKIVWYVDSDIDLPNSHSFGITWKHKGESYNPKDYTIDVILSYSADCAMGTKVKISELKDELKANGFPDGFLDMVLENALKEYQAKNIRRSKNNN